MHVRTCLFAFVSTIALVQSANAETLKKPTKPAALQHYDAAKARFEAGDIPGTIAEFLASVQIEAAPATHYNLAQSYRTLAMKFDQSDADKREHFQRALFHYQRFLASTVNTPTYAKDAQQHVDEVHAALDALNKATPAPPSEPTIAPTPSIAPAPVIVTPPPPVKDQQPTSRFKNPIAWTLIGAGAAGLVASGFLFWDASSLRDDAAHASTQREINDLNDRADRRSLTGTIVGIGSGVLVVAGIGVFVFSDPSPAHRSSASTARRPARSSTLTVSVSPSWLSLQGTF